MLISLFGWKSGLEERGEKETDLKDGIQLHKQHSDWYWGILGHAMYLNVAYRSIVRATGHLLHPRTLMTKLDTVFSLTLFYGQRKNISDKQSPELNINLIKVLAV